MYWNNQFSTYIVGSSLSASELTNLYSGNTSTSDIAGYKTIVLYVEYTPAVDTSDAYIQIEAGPDAVNLFPKAALLDTDLSGESSVKSHIFKFEAATAGIAIKRRVVIDTCDVKLRVSVKEITSGSYGTMKILLGRAEQWSN